MSDTGMSSARPSPLLRELAVMFVSAPGDRFWVEDLLEQTGQNRSRLVTGLQRMVARGWLRSGVAERFGAGGASGRTGRFVELTELGMRVFASVAHAGGGQAGRSEPAA